MSSTTRTIHTNITDEPLTLYRVTGRSNYHKSSRLYVLAYDASSAMKKAQDTWKECNDDCKPVSLEIIAEAKQHVGCKGIHSLVT